MTDTTAVSNAESPQRILLLGASGSIGRATLRQLTTRGHQVVCPLRPGTTLRDPPPGAILRTADVSASATFAADALRGERVDAVISCLAARGGGAQEAWAIDRDATLSGIAAARAAGARKAVLLSAICVQKPRLAFQHAKLAAEAALRDSGLDWSVVRPTAYFKSLSGQVDRIAAGKPYLMFGDGRGTACKPISDADLATYLADCLIDAARRNRILPIGGPGPALTPREVGGMLFDLAGREPRYRSVPPGLLSGIAGGLGLAGRVVPRLADRAEFARIGHYYATESMLVWDDRAGRYDADATPEWGSDRLREHLFARLSGEVADDRGAHAVF